MKRNYVIFLSLILNAILYLGYITSNVLEAINDFHSKTCVRFVNYRAGYHRNYIEFSNNKGLVTRKHVVVTDFQLSNFMLQWIFTYLTTIH